MKIKKKLDCLKKRVVKAKNSKEYHIPTGYVDYECLMDLKSGFWETSKIKEDKVPKDWKNVLWGSDVTAHGFSNAREAADKIIQITIEVIKEKLLQ